MGRFWARAEVSASGFAEPGFSRVWARGAGVARWEGGAGNGARDAGEDGRGWDARSARRRVSPVFGGSVLAHPAFREDALRSGAAREFVHRCVSSHGRG